MVNPRQQVQRLLSEAHGCLATGDAARSLQFVVQALRLVDGDEAILPVLQRSLEAFHKSQEKQSSLAQLSKLFADISLSAEQRLSSREQSSAALTCTSHTPATACTSSAQNYASGSMDIDEECIYNGASSSVHDYVCSRCGGVVSSARKEQHDTYWCTGLGS